MPRPRLPKVRSVWTLRLKVRLTFLLSTFVLILGARLYAPELQMFLQQWGALGRLAILAALCTPTLLVFLWHRLRRPALR